MSNSVEAKRFLGIVEERIDPDKQGQKPFGFVKPLLGSSSDQATWENRLEDSPRNRFPDEGRVFWYNVPPEYDEGSYVSFGVRKAHKYDHETAPHRYQVDDYRTPTEVVDLRSYDEKDLRGIIGTFGVKWEKEPVSGTVLIWVDDEEWVGPVGLKKNDKGRWVIQSSDPTRLDSWKPPENGCSAIQLPDGERTFLAPNQDRGERTGFKNWAPPKEFARGVLKRIRKLDSEVYEALDITYGAFEEYFEVFSEAGLTGHEYTHELARKQRLKEFIETVEENRRLLEEAAELLLESDEVQEEIQRRKKELYQEIRDELEEEVQEELKDKYDQLEELEEEIRSEEESLSSIEKQIEEAEAELDERERELSEQIAKYDKRLTEKLTQLLEKPDEAFAELAIINKAIREFSSRSTTSEDYPESMDSEEETEGEKSEAEHVGTDDVLAHVGKSFLNHRAPYFAALDLHATFVSGGLPIIDGDGAVAVLQAYAEAVTGGRVQWVSVGGSTYEPTDLLGHYDPESASIIPSRYGLLEKIKKAKQREELFLIVLEGFNRAPVESYLFPLLKTRTALESGGSDRSISLAPARLSSEDPFRSLRRVELPENLLVAATPARGTSTLPIPSEVWDYSTLLHLPSYKSVSMQEEEYTLSEVRGADWSKFAEKVRDMRVSSKLKELRDGVREEYPRFDLKIIQNRLYRAAREHVDPSAAVEILVRCNIIPRLQQPEMVSDYVDDSYTRSDGLERISEAARELTG